MQNQHIVIEAGTEAFEALKRAMQRAEERDVSVSLTYGPRGGIQMRAGGEIWTTPLTSRKPNPSRGATCDDPLCPCS